MPQDHVFALRIMMVFELWRLSKLCNRVTIFLRQANIQCVKSPEHAGCGKVHAKQKVD